MSISTVSKSLKDSHEIGKETRERIKTFAKYHGYRPNSIALSLKNRKTKTIGVIIPDVVHYFFALVVNGIEQVARKNGYNVVVALSNESFEKEVVNMEKLADSLIDGFIKKELIPSLLIKADFVIVRIISCFHRMRHVS